MSGRRSRYVIAVVTALLVATVPPSVTAHATLWSFDDETTIPERVAIDDLTVWGAWRLNGSRLSAHPIVGDGTPEFQFPAPGVAAWTGVADAETGDVVMTWTDPEPMRAVDLTDDGALALVTLEMPTLATVLDTATGEVVFQTEGAGGVLNKYRISGDGGVLVVAGVERLHVYAFDGTTYRQVVDFTRPNLWFGTGSAVSRDGSHTRRRYP